MDYIYLVHKAGLNVRGYQHCTHCGVELSKPGLSGWSPGHEIGQQMTSQSDTYQPTGGWADLNQVIDRDRSDEVVCVPR